MSQKGNEFYIHQPNILEEFLDHLSIKGNSRIIFSGPFGTGKTRFLNDFFGLQKDKFQPIYLFPVHYSVAPNYDIFELIKYDILFQLLEQDDLFNDDKFKNSFIL